MTHRIFDKTEKGREEIATRKHQLPTRLRTLLVMIDGKQNDEELLKKVSGLGLTQESVSELLDNGFIQITAQAEPSVAPAAPAEVGISISDGASDAGLLNGRSQFQAIYEFYTETIKSTIGLRGYSLQLKVEKAGSIEEFRSLRDPYLDAVMKAKGKEVARSLRTRLDQLLYIGESAPNTTVIGLNAALSE